MRLVLFRPDGSPFLGGVNSGSILVYEPYATEVLAVHARHLVQTYRRGLIAHWRVYDPTTGVIAAWWTSGEA